MTILAGDIKFVKSQVMDDVPEGGGPPSSYVITDGASNEIFADISEADRAIGRVSQRKIHLSIQSADTDTYLGGNIIVARPPNDPNVAITLFSTGDVFDTRAQATARLEAYLSVGVNFAGYQYGNVIAGQRTLQIIQRTEELQPIGATLVLTKHEGLFDETVQYIRVIEASVVLRTFTDALGDYTRYVQSIKLSDALRSDFPGFDASRADPTKAQLIAATKISESIVADAANYHGVVELQEAAVVGDFTIKAAGIFTQLVPSAQVETSIADARTNQVSAIPVAAGAPITRVCNIVVANNGAGTAFIGGAIVPGTISITGTVSGFTDRGGVLYLAGAQCGTVDYESGILYFTAGIGNSGVVGENVTYTPAAVPSTVNQSQGFKVTPENRALNYIRTLPKPPARASLAVSYAVAGRWYVLRDDGSGALRGANSSYGAGSVNFTTGTASVTLGALPDVDSAVIFQWVETETLVESAVVVVDNGGSFYWPFNTSGAASIEAGAKVIDPGSLTVQWTDQFTILRTVTDNGAGALQGCGTGSVNYAKGSLRLSPTNMPPPGTVMNVTINGSPKTAATVAVASGAGNIGATNVKPGSVSMVVTGQQRGQYLGNPIVNWGPAATYRIVDNGAGGLDVLLLDSRVHVGTINYTTGDFALVGNTVIPSGIAIGLTAFDNIYLATNDGLQMFVESI